MNNDLEVYGCNFDDYLTSVKASISYRVGGKEMIIMSILSDAQELIAMGLGEKARQEINIAKRLLHEIGVK
jgi:hypothetical protein